MKYKLRQATLAVPAIASGLLFTALPPSVMAQSVVPYKLVDTANALPDVGTEDSPISYTGDGDYAALHIIGDGTAGNVAYNGTWLTLTGDPSATNSANSGMAANVSAGGELRLYNSTLVTSTPGETMATGRRGILADASTVYIENSNITTNSLGTANQGIMATNGSSVVLLDTNVTTHGTYSNAVFVASSSRLEATGGTVETFGALSGNYTYSNAFQFDPGSTGTVQEVTIITHSAAARGVSVTSSYAEVSRLDITTGGDHSFGIYVEEGGTLIADNVIINTSGSTSSGIALGWRTNTNDTKAIVTNSTVNVTGKDAAALRLAHSPTNPESSDGGNFILEVTGGTYTSAQGAGLELARGSGIAEAHKVTITDAQIIGPQSVHVTGFADATIGIGNSELTGDVTFDGTGKTTLTLANSTTLTGNVHASDSAQASILLKGGSVLTGSVNRDGTDSDQELNLDITGSTWTSTGSSTVHDLTLENATLNLTLDNLTDAINVGGTLEVVSESQNNVSVDLSDSLLAKILAETETGSAVIDVFVLITGSETFVGEGGSLLNYTVLDKNAAGSTYTVQHLEEGKYEINGIVLAAVPEPATCAALAGLTLLAYALLRRRRSCR
jgi:hypothetical protein